MSKAIVKDFWKNKGRYKITKMKVGGILNSDIKRAGGEIHWLDTVPPTILGSSEVALTLPPQVGEEE